MITKTKSGFTIQGAVVMQPKEFDYNFLLKLSFEGYDMKDMVVLSKPMFEEEKDAEMAIYDAINVFFDFDETGDLNTDEYRQKVVDLYTKYDVTCTSAENITYVEGKKDQ